MMEQISIYLTSIILGIMLFFSFVVAPVTFTALDEENARKFIRKIFPYYYIVNLTISVLVLILFIIQIMCGILNSQELATKKLQKIQLDFFF